MSMNNLVVCLALGAGLGAGLGVLLLAGTAVVTLATGLKVTSTIAVTVGMVTVSGTTAMEK